MAISDYLNSLVNDRNTLVTNLTTKGITGLTGDETFTELVPEVLNIPSGGSGSKIEWDTTALTFPSGNQGSATYYKTILARLKELTIKDVAFAGNITVFSLWPLNGLTVGDESNSLQKLYFENCTFSHTTTANTDFLPTFITEVSYKNCNFSNATGNISCFSHNNSASLTTATFENCDFSGSHSLAQCFSGFKGTQLILDSNVIKGNPVVTSMDSIFRYNSNLTLLDISAFDFTQCTSSSARTYAFGSVPTNCTIYVKDQANQTFLSAYFSAYTFTVKT